MAVALCLLVIPLKLTVHYEEEKAIRNMDEKDKGNNPEDELDLEAKISWNNISTERHASHRERLYNFWILLKKCEREILKNPRMQN